jgi:hypothetical protein
VLTFPQILIGVFGSAGLLLAVILLVVLLPRRDHTDGRDALPPMNGRNGDGFTADGGMRRLP